MVDHNLVQTVDDESSSVNGDGTPSSVSMTFSEAIDAMGMGPFQKRLFIMCGMAWLIDAIEILVIAFAIDDIARTFHLGSFSKGLVGSASFFGMLFGAMFWSVYADRNGRRGAFVRSLGFVFVSGLASAFAPSFGILLVFRTLVGFGVGGNIPVTNALMTEFLPTKDRAKVLCHIGGVFWGLGLMAASLLGLLLTHRLRPGQEETMWRWFLGLSAVPAIMVCFAYRLLPESPRYLSVVGRHDDAAKILEEVARTNGRLDVLGLTPSGQLGEGEKVRLQQGLASDDPTGYGRAGGAMDGETGDDGVVASRIHIRPEEEAKRAGAGEVRELFRTPILRRVTLCVWMVWLFSNTSYYGLTFLLPRYYGEFSHGRKEVVFVLTTIIGASFVPASFVALSLCSEDRLGRVGTLKWSSLATALLIFAMAIFRKVPALFIPLSILTVECIAVPSIVKYVITPELYMTKYRAVGLGSASVWTRLGGILAPVLAEVLFDKVGPLAPLVVFGPTMILTAIFAGMIPVETAGRKLDDDSWDRREPTVEMVGMEGVYSVPTADA